jgi:hypothetical protein
MEFAPGPTEALMIGHLPAQTPLERLFARSHWIRERRSTLNEGMERLRQERIPAVFCQVDDCRPVARAVASLDRPPLVFALSPEAARDDGWIEVIGRNVYKVRTKELSRSRLFPLLNHAWRACNGIGPE